MKEVKIVPLCESTFKSAGAMNANRKCTPPHAPLLHCTFSI